MSALWRSLRRAALPMVAAACAVACTPRGPDPERLKAVGATVGGLRPLAELDASGDGRIDEVDWQAFDAIAQRAHSSLGAQDPRAVRAALYHGPAEKAPSVFSLLRWRDGGVDLSGVPPERLVELAVEARWNAGQARMAARLPPPLDGRGFGGLFRTELPSYDAGAMEPGAVCSALQALDLTPYTRAGVPAAAVFDLDSTVWDGNVSETFLAVLAHRKVPKPEANGPLQEFLKGVDGIDDALVDRNDVAQNAALLYQRSTSPDVPPAQRINLKDSFVQTVALLKGLDAAAVQAAARATVEEGTDTLPPHGKLLYADEDGCSMRRIVGILEGRGIRVYVLSATLDVLAKEAARLLGLRDDQVLGTLLEVDHAVYTGKVADSTYYTKGAIVRQWLDAPPIVAFGDSATSDFSMLLEAAGAAFMVNAKDSFRKRDDEEASSRLVALNFDGTERTIGAR